MVQELELKRLGFVRSYASAAVTRGEGLYKTARGFVPSFVEPYVARLEDSATAVAAPLVVQVQDKAAGLLAAVDVKVDSLAATLSSTLDYGRELHAANMSSFGAARASYYSLVEGAVTSTRAVLDPQRYMAYASGVGKAVRDALVAHADPDKAVAAASNVYDKIASRGPVLKALELADPLITVGQTQYTKAHDVLVMQPLYKRIYDTAATLPAKVSDTTIYKKTYPLVAPVADPVYSNFANSKVIKQLDEHLKPKTA